MKSPKVIDLFCGAGGLALGLQKAGFKISASVEMDPKACATYRNNFGSHLIERDIHQLSVSELLEFAGISPWRVPITRGRASVPRIFNSTAGLE